MAIQITSKENQAKGAFAAGLIIENKPIGFPQDGGSQRPYTNLFYWANAWSDKGGLIPEHPHKMFEIMSFVLEGEIRHYDSKNNDWFTLTAGDVQIIRAGKGITHAERLMENSRIFQIWFDPNIQETMNHEASYDDYESNKFPREVKDDVTIKHIVGKDAPVQMHSEGIEIKEFQISSSTVIPLKMDKIYSLYLIEGSLSINGSNVVKDDFIILEDEPELIIENVQNAKLFCISTSKKLSYKTYNQLVKF